MGPWLLLIDGEGSSVGCRVIPEDVGLREGNTELLVERRPAKLTHMRPPTASIYYTYICMYLLSVPLQHRG
jgi:hypothetical protein